MRLPDSKDDTIWKTIRFAARQSFPEKFAANLLQRAENDTENAEYWYEYGLCCFEFMNIVEQSQAKHRFLCGAINSCTRAVNLDADHWPALYIRSQVAILLEIADNSMLASYLLPPEYRLEDAVRDQLHMISIQEKLDPQPYFFIPFAVLCLVYFSQGKEAEGREILLRGAGEIPEGKIGVLSRVLSIPLALLKQVLHAKGCDDLLCIVEQRLRKAFPAGKSQVIC
ncbi:MAG: hypothetical protein GX089_11185 [Fibrobacter sp.]|jgi:hypothetical protein|nr:hypothetical protein [Fibrobacter sp.]